MITPYPDVANSGAFFFSFLGWYCTGNAAISWCGHHFSYCWSCKVPLVHGSYTFAMFRWCSPLSQWCLSCLITIRYSVIWCYLMLFGYSLVIKHGLLENPYRFFFFFWEHNLFNMGFGQRVYGVYMELVEDHWLGLFRPLRSLINNAHHRILQMNRILPVFFFQ